MAGLPADSGLHEPNSMSIRVQCPCGQSLKTRDESAGRQVKCPRCGQAVSVPPAETSPATTSPTAAQPPGPIAGASQFTSAETGTASAPAAEQEHAASGRWNFLLSLG